MKRSLSAALIATASLLPLALFARAAHAQSGVFWRAEDRVLISDFSRITGLARDHTTLYGVTPNGLIVYDITTRRFLAPLTQEDGFPQRERPLAVAYSPSEFRVLIGTSSGGLHTLTTGSARFENVTRLNGAVTRLLSSRDDADTYAETTQGWYRLRNGSFFPEPVTGPPASAQMPGSSDPYLRSMIGSAGSVPGRGTAPVAAIEADRSPGSYFAGTLGNGLVHLDTRALTPTRLPFGLNTRGAGAVAAWRGRVWFGGDARTNAGPLVSATPELSQFQEYPPSTGAPQDLVTALLGTDSALWVGTSTGLYSFAGPPGRERWQPRPFAGADRVTSLAADTGRGRTGVFVGTDHGAGRMSGAGVWTPILEGPYVFGLEVSADTLWMATGLGIVAYPLDGSGSAAALRGGGTPAEPVLDIRATADTLYAVTAESVYRRGSAGWSLPDRAPSQRLGPLGRVRTDGSTVWVLGTLGFAMKRAQSGVWSYHSAPEDIPEAPVRDLLRHGDVMWLATPAGALRIPFPR